VTKCSWRCCAGAVTAVQRVHHPLHDSFLLLFTCVAARWGLEDSFIKPMSTRGSKTSKHDPVRTLMRQTLQTTVRASMLRSVVPRRLGKVCTAGLYITYRYI